jgi:hypothetical protein
MVHQHAISPFSSLVRPKNYYPNPHHGDSNIWEGTTGGRPTSRKKCASIMRGFHMAAATGLLMGTTCFADAKHRPHGAIGSEVEGVGNATTGSVTDKLTREHRMTLDEAHLILNAKRGEAVERILQVRPSVCSDVVHRRSANFFVMIRITNTCLKPTRRRKRHRQMRLADGVARGYLGIHTTCSQRWCGHESGSRQNWRWQGKKSRQQRQDRVRV